MRDFSKYQGVIPAFYACYDDLGAVSATKVRELTRYLIGKGVKGLYVGGSSGECIYQSVEERKLVLENVMAEARGKVTIIAHVACNNTSDSQALAAHAESLGVDAIAAIPPIYFHLPDYAIAKYWNDISAAAPNTDFVIYNIPQLAGVAIGRAIVREPKVLLMDEPLSNLDAKLRNQMRAEIIKLRQRINTTFVYVTHDQTEAMTLGDRIVIMKDGFVQQIGTPQEVFEKPINIFVAGFIGTPQMNFFNARLEKKGGDYSVEYAGASFPLDGEMSAKLAGKGQQSADVILGVRPEHIAVQKDPSASAIEASIEVSELMGSELYLHATVEGGQEVVIRTPTVELPAEYRGGVPYGTKLRFTFSPSLIHLFDPESEKSLLV